VGLTLHVNGIDRSARPRRPLPSTSDRWLSGILRVCVLPEALSYHFMLLVASPFSRTKDAVVNAASDLILTAQHELQKIETDPNLTLTQKVAFKNALAEQVNSL
jgi:hypothetical protein